MIAPLQHIASGKHRARKLKEPIDVKFLKCSSHISNLKGGFHFEKVMEKPADYPNIYQGATSILRNLVEFLQKEPKVVRCSS